MVHDVHMNTSCHTYDLAIFLIRMRDFTLVNASCSQSLSCLSLCVKVCLNMEASVGVNMSA